jgi:membrane complex biogenesis BtpA family protein
LTLRTKHVDLDQIFDTQKPVIGVVHLLPLPTSPRWGGSLKDVIDRAEQEAVALASGGVHGIILENFFDAPFTNARVDPAVVSAMSLVAQRIKQMVAIPIGINVLRNDAHSALAIAACVGAKFIRVNVLTGVMATDQGIIEGDAYHLLRYRRELGCDIKIFADVLVKHAYPMSAPDLSLAIQDTVNRGLADAVILSGQFTGHAPHHQELASAKQTCLATASNNIDSGVPMFIGSGATWDNIPELIKYADGVIVSSSLKRHGKIQHPIDPNRVHRFVDALRHGLQKQQESLNSHKPEAKAPSSLPIA